MVQARLNVDDKALVHRARRGEERAFEELVRRHTDLAYRVSLRMMRNPHDAEYTTQVAFLRAWEALDGFRGDAAFTSWLYRIVTTTCLDQLRARRHWEEVPDTLVDPRANPLDDVIAAESADVVRAAIGCLSPGDRAAFLLRTFEQLSYAEVGTVLDVSVGAVRSRLRRARTRIADALEAAQAIKEDDRGR